MHSFNYAAVGFCAALLVGCATPHRKALPPPTDYVPLGQIEIPSRFATAEVTRERFAQELNKCIPKLDANSQNITKELQNFPLKDVLVFKHESSANAFMLREATAVCLQKSSEKFPIFAAEAFFETVNPKGVPPDVVDGWYKQIALLIATKGTARIAYVFDNGNAFTTTYWVETRPEYGLNYSSVFKKAGAWETEKFDVQFSHPTMTSVSETKRTKMNEKPYPLAHRSK